MGMAKINAHQRSLIETQFNKIRRV